MTAETKVYFPLTGTEAHAFVRVRLFGDQGANQAEATLGGPMTSSQDEDGLPITGEPHQVLRQAREWAGVRGLDLRVQLDGIEWDPDLGSLVR